MRALVAALLLVFMGCEARDAVSTDPFACTGAGDCSGGFGCLIDRCVPEAQLVCEADGDCPTPWVCEAGRCAAPRGGRCQPEAGTCPDGFSCTDGRCARDAECRDDVDCGEGSVCGPGQVCVGCVVDGDCPPGERCVAQACGDGCRGDQDCGAEQICATGACVDGCRLDSDCDGPRICEDGTCEGGCTGPQDCDADERCELGRCKPQAGCADDSDCEGDLACRDGECVPYACADVADCPDAMTWGCFEGVCLRRECEDGALCEGGAFCRDGQCTDCVATAECREQGRAGWQCWDGFCLPPCDPLSACCGEDGDGNRVRLAECEASAQVRCAHRPEFVCDRQQVKESFEGTCALDPAAPEQRMVCEYDPERSPVLVEPTGECNAAADLFCVEDDAGNADCDTRRECDCDAQRDHTPCLLGEGRCVVEMCRGWRCDEAECNSRGPWFAFPFVERLDPLEPLPNQDAHVIRGEPYMDVEWAFPGLEIRKASQWDAHTHCADLGVGVAGADTDWRLPTLHELITLTQREPEVEDLELPAISRTVFNDAAMVVYFGEPPDGGPRVRPVPLENPDRQRFWPVCVRPAFQPAAADLPPLRRGLGANGGLRDGVDEWTGASWTQAGEVATFALARQACNEAGARLPTVSEVYSLLDFHPRPDGVGLPVDVLTGRPQRVGVRVWAGLPGDGVAQVDLGSGEVFAADDALPRAEARCVQAPCQDDLDCLGAQVCDGGWCAPDDANPDDPDGDGLEGNIDNCPEDPNPDQTDTDGDGQGDACDECPRTARHDDPCCNRGEWAADGSVVDVGQPRQVCEGGGCGSAVLEIVSRCECRDGASEDCFEDQRELVDCGDQWCDPQTLDCRFIAACAEAEAVDCAEAEEHTPCVVPGQPNKPARCVVGQCCGFDRADAACNELGPGFTQPLRAQGLQLLPLGGAVFADEGTGLVWHDSGVDARTRAALHRACAEVRLDADNDGEADRWRLPTFLELLTLAPTDLVNLPGLFGNNRTFASRTMLGAGFYAVDLADLRSRVINDNMDSAGALCVLVDEPAETHPRPRTFELIGDGVYEDPWTGWRVKEADIGDSRAQAAIACNEQGLGGEAWRLPKAKDVSLLMRYHQAPAYTVSGQALRNTRVWLDELRVAGLAPGDRLLNLESGQIEWASGRPAAIRCVAPPVAEGGQ